MEIFKIERNIPIPSTTVLKYCNYPFKKMKIGYSFLVPFRSNKTEKQLKDSVYNRAHQFSIKSNHKINFSVKITSDGIRIWRTK